MNTPARILIVEDDAVLATELQETLTQLGYQVSGLAATGKTAVKSALEQKPDVILMDIRLRGAMTGIQAVEQIRQQQNIPVVYLTAFADEALLQQAKVTDAYAYLVKPVRERELRAGLEMALYKHAAEQRLQHLNQILRAVRDVNQLITREHDAQRLMDEACQILLRAHGYQFVWIGESAGDRLKPRASAGDGQKLIARIVASATPEQGLKLPGTEASRTRSVTLCHDMLHDERYAPWREEVEQAHFSSTVAVPIFHEESLFGVLNVYSDQTNIFDAEEIDLLLEMAGDIAFGLKAIDGEAERQRAAETLRLSENKFSQAFHGSPGIFAISTIVDGRFIDVNDSFLQFAGYVREEVIGRSVFDLNLWADPEQGKRLRMQLQEQGYVRNFESTYRRKSGEIGYGLVSAAIISVEGQPCLLTETMDITERKRMEDKLRESESKFRAVVENSNDGILFGDANAVIHYRSPSYNRINGYSDEERLGHSGFDTVHPDDAADLRSWWVKMLESPGISHRTEYRIRHKDGSWRWIETSGQNLLGNPDVHSVVVTSRDITERKQAESQREAALEALRENRGFLSDLIENNGALIYVKDLDGRYELVNKKWEEVTGLERKTSIGRTDEELFPGRVGENFRQMDVQIMEHGAMREIEEAIEDAMGTRVFLSIKFPLRDKNNAVKGLCGISTDITKRKRTEVALWLSEQAARRTAEQLRMVNQINVKITAGLDFEQLMQTIHEQCQQIGDTDTFYVALYDEATGMVRFPFNFKDGERRPNPSRNIRETPGLLGHVIASRQTLYIPDELNLPAGLTLVHQAGTPSRSLIIVPLILNERVVGALSMQSHTPDAYTPEQVHTLELLAIQVAIAIQNSQLYEQVQNELLERKRAEEETALKNKHLTMLNHLGQALNSLAPLPEILERVSDLTGQVLDNRNLYIALYDEATNLVSFPIYWMTGERKNSMRSRPLSNGLTEFVIRARAPILIPDHVQEMLVERGIALIGTPCQCYLGVPILIDEHVVGVIAVQDYERAQVYNVNHVELLSTIASQAAIAIQNARLYETVQQELAERKRAEETLQQQNQILLALQNTTLELVSQLELKTLLENIVKRACALVGTSAGLLDLVDPATNQLIPQIGVGALEESLHLRVQPGEGLAGIVWQTGEMLVVPDYDQWAGRLDKFSQSTLGSVIGVPLLSDSNVIGVLATGSAYGFPHHFDPAAIEILNQFARLATVAVQNARLFANLQTELAERKRAEEALRESQALTSAIVNSTADLIWSVDPEKFGLLTFNDGLSNYFIQRRAIRIQTGMRPEELFPTQEYIKLWHDFYQRALSEGSYTVEYGVYAKTNVLLLTFNLLKRDGQVFGISVFGRDITERKQAEERIQQSEKKYRELFQVNKDGIAIFPVNPYGPPSAFVEINGAAHQMLGYSMEEMLQLTPTMLEPYTPQEQLRFRQSQFESKGVLNFETVLQHKDGHPVFAEFTAQMIRYEGKPAIMNIVRDITERKQRENELQAIATLSAALRAAPTRIEILKVIVEQLSDLLHCDSMSAEIIDPTTQEAVVEAAHGVWTAFIGLRQPLGTGLNAIIYETRRPYHNNNLDNAPPASIPISAMEGILAGVGVPLFAQEQLIGFLWMGRKTEIAESEVRLLAAVADIAANAIHRATLHEQTQKDAANLALAYDTTLEGWVHALELRDQETEGHTRRVMQMTVDLARTMGIDECELENVRRGALLHDIGKMGIPDSILLKPGALDEHEWVIMRQHPEYAYKLLEPIEYLRPVLNIPYCHHERWDGSGYPRNLKGEEIPLEARIFAIVDVWDALTSDRPYRKAWTKEKALTHIAEQSRKHFDPAVAEVFMKII